MMFFMMDRSGMNYGSGVYDGGSVEYGGGMNNGSMMNDGDGMNGGQDRSGMSFSVVLGERRIRRGMAVVVILRSGSNQHQ